MESSTQILELNCPNLYTSSTMNKSDLSFLTYKMGVIMSTIANQYKIKLNKYIQNTKNRT